MRAVETPRIKSDHTLSCPPYRSTPRTSLAFLVLPAPTVAESSAAPLECKLFSLNVVPKPEMLSVRAEYVLSSLQVGITTPIVRTQAARSKRVARGLRPSSGGPARRPGASHRAARPASPFAPRP